MIEIFSYPRLSKWLPLLIHSVSISQKGIHLQTGKGSDSFDWTEILQPTRETVLWLFHSVTVRTNTSTNRLYFLTKPRCETAWRQILKQWYGPRVEAADHRLQALGKILPQNGYIRSSHWEPLRIEVDAFRECLPPVPSEGILEKQHHNWLLAAYQQFADSDALLDRLRERYIQKALTQYEALFNTIESQPLTPKQRRACVIDEDNNLILAGAGTGKTSTVIGRVAFLVRSKQARPEEILLLAYGGKAAEEMRDRLENRLGVKGITAETFHALGKWIVEEVEHKKAHLSPMATDRDLKKKFVDDAFLSLQRENPAYQELLLTYFENWLYPARNPFEFKTLGEYYSFLEDNDVRTLKSEKVKGFGECDIANFLFKNGIEYIYEPRYPIPAHEQSRARGPYKPDFYLTEHKVYIEHFGTDRLGDTAPYIDRAKYHADMAWKRKLHEKVGTTLIETFHYEKQEGTLLKALKQRLSEVGVPLNPLEPDTLLETLRELGSLSHFSKILTEMLELFRAANLSIQEQIDLIKRSENPDQIRAALELLAPIITIYEKNLSNNDEVDFDDMINKAIEYLENGLFTPPWKFIVVDEFQDIAKSRAELVQTIRKKREGVSLFCVGDDWQSIYRFAGSDITFTSEFKKRFGPTQISDLDMTFRFNSMIGDVANRFVRRNKQQLAKDIKSHTTASTPTVSLMRTAINAGNAPHQVVEPVVQRINQIANQGSSVYFLARFKHDLPSSDELRKFGSRFPNLIFKRDSIHSSKGKEADYVILLGLSKGKYGIPSEIVTNPLTEALLPPREAFPHAEERRLFYVAITRARHRVYLICDMLKCSPFVEELLQDGYPLELEEFITPSEQLHALKASCPTCTQGYLTTRTNRKNEKKFIGCTNYPRCTHQEECCDKCNSPMQRSGRFRICIKATCGWWVPICPISGGALSYKKEFKFWGCSDYRGNDPDSCTHKEWNVGTPPTRP